MASLRHVVLAGLIGVSLLSFAGCAQQAASDQQSAQADTVYGRIGEAKIGELVTAWYKDAAGTPAERLTKPYSVEQMTGLLADKLGSPTPFLGKDVKSAYAGLNVSDDEWKSFMDSLGKAADEVGLSPLDREQILVTIDPMKQDVVGQ